MGGVRRRSSLATAGRILLALSVVVVLFVGYQLWGTGIVQARQQASLRSRFERSLGVQREGRAPGAPAAVTPGPPTADPAVGQPVGTLVIPRIGLDQVVVEGTGPSQLAAGPGHYPGTPLPGQQGNAAIAGHRTTHGRPFYDLDALASGDPITVTTLQGTFHYRRGPLRGGGAHRCGRTGPVVGSGADADHLHPALQRRPATGGGGAAGGAGRRRSRGHRRPSADRWRTPPSTPSTAW